MRLDAHVHIYGESTIKDFRPYVEELGITHYVAILKENDLGLVDQLARAGAIGIPFHWLDLTRDALFSDVAVAGYKIHLRQTPPRPSGPLLATAADIGHICAHASAQARPILFHTDGDDPSPNSVSMLAQLCHDFPRAILIAGHTGVYTQETFHTRYSADVFQRMIEHLWRLNLSFVQSTPNLYGDLTKFGMDYAQRSDSHLHRAEAFVKVVHELSRADRRKLVRKLFCGTDFPNFSPAGHTHADAGLEPDVIAASNLLFQIRCMQEAFDDAFDESHMVARFLDLLPSV